MSFFEWWDSIGSGVTVDRGDDHEEHAKKVAAIAWIAALEDAANKFDGTTAYNWTAADGYANSFDIASELRYMATETPNAKLSGAGYGVPGNAPLSHRVRLSAGLGG